MDSLVDFGHPIVRERARRLTENQHTQRAKLERIFFYVRDGIAFYFPPEGDFVRASETIRMGRGQRNTKGTLFLALCRALAMPARIHFSLIGKETQRGTFAGVAYKLMPRELSHSWVEVLVDGEWCAIDAYINDLPFQRGAVAELGRRGWETGFSVTRRLREPGADLTLGEGSFEEMRAIVDDHGVWDDPTDYFASDLYRNRFGPLMHLGYRVAIWGANRRVEATRRCGAGELTAEERVSSVRSREAPAEAC